MAKFYLLLWCFLFWLAPLYSQTPVVDYSFTLEQENERIPLLLTESNTLVEICGLRPGVEYQFFVVPHLTRHQDLARLLPVGQKVKTLARSGIGFTIVPEEECMLLEIALMGEDLLTEDVMVDLSAGPIGSMDGPGLSSLLQGIMVDPNYTAQQLIEDIFVGGGCFDVANVTTIGNAGAMGYFWEGTTSVGFKEGVILSSGLVTSATGPNNAGNTGFVWGSPNGDPDLNQLVTGNVLDVVGIEFDFTPTVDSIVFNFAFASEEYCEYVNSQFNDVFGFFISGPGINGPYTNGAENIAVVPGTNTPVTINTINHLVNTNYFVSNDQATCGLPAQAFNEIEYDGFTRGMRATALVTACETYRIRLVLSDVGDGQWDSAVFLEANSFEAGGRAGVDVNVPATGTNILYEGCGSADLIFLRDSGSDITKPLVVTFYISSNSTATNGVDYTGVPLQVTIPPGQSQLVYSITAFEDLIPEGTESIIFVVENACDCDLSMAEILIEDLPPLEVSLDDVTLCEGDAVTLSPAIDSGPIGDKTYQWSNGATDPSITVTPTATTTYTVTVTDICGQTDTADAEVVVTELPSANMTASGVLCNTSDTAYLTVNFTGTGPWELVYSFEGIDQPTIITTENPLVIPVTQAGWYQLVSVATGPCPGTVIGDEIISEVEINLSTIAVPTACEEVNTGAINLIVWGGDLPYSFEWSNGEIIQNPDQLDTGTYTVTVTDLNGCTAEITDSIGVSPPMELQFDQTSIVSCLGYTDGALELDVTNGSAPYTFLWNNGAATQNLDSIGAGMYSVTVTDLFGCEVSDSTVITEPPGIELDASVTNNISCYDTLGGAIDITLTGGSPNYIITWSNGSSEEDQDSLPQGIYTVEVLDTNGCITDSTFDLAGNFTTPVAEAGPSDTLTCSAPGMTLDGSASTNDSTVVFLWETTDGNIVSGADSLTPTIDLPGTYFLTITNLISGCSESDSVVIFEDADVPLADAGPSPTITCSTSSVQLDGSNSDSGANISYLWTTTNGIILTDPTTISPTVGAPGTYTLTVFDAGNGCSGEATVEVLENTVPPAVEAGPPFDLDCDALQVQLDGTGSATGPGYSYQWTTTQGVIDSGDTTLFPLVSGAGMYYLEVTDASNGCTATDSVEVSESIDLPMVDAGPGQVVTCDHPVVTLDGSGSQAGDSISYEWSTLDGNIVSGANTTTPEVDAPGTYTLTVTNSSNGCFNIADVVVTEDKEAPLSDAGQAAMLNCEVTTLTLDGSGSSSGAEFTYAWTTNDGHILSGDDTPNPVVDSAGTYTLTVTNTSNGCTAEDSVTVLRDAVVPLADAGNTDTLNCVINSLVLQGSGSTGPRIVYEWNTTNGNIVIGGNTLNPVVDAPGFYVLTVRDTFNKCVNTSIVTIGENVTPPLAEAGNGGLLTCAVTSLQLDASGSSQSADITYNWTTNNGNIVSGASDIDPVIDAPGRYDLLVTNQHNGCTATDTVTVDENVDTPVAEAGPTDEINCTVTAVTLDGSGSTVDPDIVYEWNSPDGNILSGGNTLNPVVDEAGTYTLTVLDTFNGCFSTDVVVITQDANLPVADAGSDSTLTCDVTTIVLDGSNSSTGPNITFDWTTTGGNFVSGQNTLTPTINAPGNYTLTISDQSNNCTVTATVVIDEDVAAPIVDIQPAETLTCNVTSIQLDASGSSQGSEFEYNWTTSNGVIDSDGDTPEPTVSTPGDYDLLITNTRNGCTTTGSVNVPQDTTTPTADAGAPQVLNCLISSVVLDGSASSSGFDFTYLWTTTNGNITGDPASATPAVDAPGTYDLLVTNTRNGCTATASVEVMEDVEIPPLSFTVPEELNCNTISTAITANENSSDPDLVYSWTTQGGNILNGAGDQTVEVDAPGLYICQVTNNRNGCTHSDTVAVSQDIEAPVAEAGGPDTLICDRRELLLDGTGSTTGANITYNWTTTDGNILGGDTGLTPEVNAAGTYTLTVVNNDNGCTNTGQVRIAIDTVAPVVDAGTDDELTCLITSLQLDGSGTDQGDDYIYQWLTFSGNIVDGATTLTPMIDAPGTYVLSVLNSTNHCTSTDEVVITENVLPPTPVIDLPSGDMLDCDTRSLVLDAGNSQSQGTIDFEWTTIDGQIVSGSNAASATIDQPGTYTLVITDNANGCTASDQVTIRQDVVPPVVEIEEPALLTCLVTEVNIDATSSSGGSEFEYDWKATLGGNIVSGGGTLTPTVDQPGVYVLVVTNTSNGCTTTGDIRVAQDITKPKATARVEGELNCVTEQVDLVGEGSSQGPVYTYRWTTTDGRILGSNTTLNIVAGQAGTYTLEVTNNYNGCTNSVDLVVTDDDNVPKDMDLSVDPPLCNGHPGSIFIDSVFGGTEPYLYSLDGENFFRTPIFRLIDPGTYTVYVQDAIGCGHAKEVTVPEPIGIAVETFPTEVLVEFGDSRQLHAQVNYPDLLKQITWKPGDWLSCTNCLDPVTTPLHQILYTIEVEDIYGCTDEAQVMVRVEKARDVFIPSAFSPGNGDGNNDIFMIFANDDHVVNIETFQVFDRWGEAVFAVEDFQPNDPAYGWDGTFRGQQLSPGVYVYFAEIQFVDGETKMYKGSVTLVK